MEYTVRQREDMVTQVAHTLATVDWSVIPLDCSEQIMNTSNFSLSAALAVAALAMTPSFAAAADARAPHEVTVYYDELNMSTERGATALYSRLRAASREVCAPLEGRDLRQRAAFNACYSQALSNAVARVNRTAVTALHVRVAKGVKAS
jgi:UrcA family protein